MNTGIPVKSKTVFGEIKDGSGVSKAKKLEI
jgi:hypothetical protein